MKIDGFVAQGKWDHWRQLSLPLAQLKGQGHDCSQGRALEQRPKVTGQSGEESVDQR